MSGESRTCEYCELPFTGAGYSPDGKTHYCCYGCHLVHQITDAKREEGIASWLLLRLGIGGFLAMNVMMISLVFYTTPEAEIGESAVQVLRWAMLFLSTPVLLILGTPFILSGVRCLRNGRISMDTLIATGSVSAFSVSAFHTIRGSGHVYFDTATMLLFIVTMGRLIEASAKSRTAGAIKDVIDLIPNIARVVRDGEEAEIPTSEVQVGDKMIIKPGERIPADGKIVSGECLVMESAFTGESRPRPCAVGDAVYGGSVDCDGLIKVEATAVGSSSILEQIRQMVQRAQQERAPIERLAERISTAFVPIVWLAAIGAGVYWGAFNGDTERAGMSALAVLVVACPCALGLATPIATSLAIGLAARMGTLISSGEALERLPNIKKVYFDKTGTLTSNRLSVAEVTTHGDVSPNQALALAAAVESGSEHVIAHALIDEAASRGVNRGELLEFEAAPGRGARGIVRLNDDEVKVTVGSLKLLLEGHSLPESLIQAGKSNSLTTVFVGWRGEVRAAISLQDSIRPEAQRAITDLRHANIKTSVVSGDQPGPTSRVAQELGIDEVISECSPAQKAEAIQMARKRSRHAVAMVGDGINDAPALAEADVGIAIGGGTDLARQSSDVTLMGDDISRIPQILTLSSFTYKVIRQNLLWAFGYNSVAIVAAFLGYVHPLIAAVAMVVSSATVLANSLRILRWTSAQNSGNAESFSSV